MNNKQNVLICPLNWGLGHATRDIPIIKELIKNDYFVIIGADKAPLALLKKEFPNLSYITIPSFEIKYSSKQNMVWKMLISLPKIIWNIYKEHQQLKKIINKHKIDIIISDNRYGCWHQNIYSIFITHQLNIQIPKHLFFIKNIANKINLWLISKYNECWVPDFESQNNIAGNLSHPKRKPKRIKYIGLLSRFQNLKIKQTLYNYTLLVILSGPEPQRSILQNILEKQILLSKHKALFVLGKPESKGKYTLNNIDFVNHLPANKLAGYILSTPYVISRAGYSSIMDYIYLKKTAILIPTPGQTEQEYLAKYMKEKKYFYSVSQNEFDLNIALQAVKNFSISGITTKPDLLSQAILNPHYSPL